MLSRQARQKHLNDFSAGRSELFWRLTWYKKTIIGIALKKGLNCVCMNYPGVHVYILYLIVFNAFLPVIPHM